jgi:hypothetical protein
LGYSKDSAKSKVYSYEYLHLKNSNNLICTSSS